MIQRPPSGMQFWIAVCDPDADNGGTGGALYNFCTSDAVRMKFIFLLSETLSLSLSIVSHCR